MTEWWRMVGRVVATVGALALAACGSSTASDSASAASSASAPPFSTNPSPTLPVGMTVFGFPTVADSGSFTPGQPLVLRAGALTVSVPADALDTSATVQVLTDEVAFWQSFAPAGQKVVAAFAFRVVNSNGAEVTAFKAPIGISYTSPAITSTSQYLNTTRSRPPTVSVNPVPPTISGTTLIHGNIGDGVGWLITSPR